VAIKFPRFAFEKFPGTPRILSTQMKSVGEVMSLGRTFTEALFKGLRSLEWSRPWWEKPEKASTEEIIALISESSPDRLPYILEALRRGVSQKEVAERTLIDPWFIRMFARAAETINEVREDPIETTVRKAKTSGLSDAYIGYLTGQDEFAVRHLRTQMGIIPTYKMVDTCAAEFEASTPYFYSSYDSEDETIPSDRPKVLILGSGPNRIGQGIEFDYCCVQASFALQDIGYETIMLNSNPETVSTDYDTSDRLYFDPVDAESVLDIMEKENPIGIIVQFGGQTPLNISRKLEKQGAKILGTSTKSIGCAESREEFARLVDQLEMNQAANGTAQSLEQAVEIARRISYPVLVRPSYILGGSMMNLLYDEENLKTYLTGSVQLSPASPVLIDHFLEDAFEYDIDAVSDGKDVVIGAVMQHIEEAGIHSGDSACSVPAIKSKREWIETMKEKTRLIARALSVVGLINIQFAVKDDVVYVLEVNPRASRTVPFVSKATGVNMVRIATAIMMGKTLRELAIEGDFEADYFSVKESVLPFNRFPGVDPVLAPEMRSTGEVMGVGASFGEAFYKAELAAGTPLPTDGTVFISVNDYDKPAILPVARKLNEMGFRITATKGTAEYLWKQGVWTDVIRKIHEDHPNALDYIRLRKIDLFINTPLAKNSQIDDYMIRDAAIKHGIPYTTTTSAAIAAVEGIEAKRRGHIFVRHLQENPNSYSFSIKPR
jgi:carbamoyl-phosphate synthase large subunit